MARRIIDSHAHLGDIFHYNKNISFKTNVKKGDYEDRFIDLEESLFTKPLFTGDPHDLDLVIDGGQYRCWESTLENLTKQLDDNDMAGIVMLPVLPNTSFEEYLAASKLEPRIIPFTAADMTLPIDEMCAKLRKDIGRGAKGLKLHPVLQCVRLTDERMYAAAKVFAEVDLPVVVHVGEGIYYHPDMIHHQVQAYGSMQDFFEFAHNLPDQVIIGAHCAAFAQAFMEGVKGLENVYSDTSFSSVAAVKDAMKYMGPDRVLYGTDYPFTYEKYNIQVIDEALANDPIAKDKVFYANIAKLLHL